jgi:hypothetical protein
MDYLKAYPGLGPILAGGDHIDLKIKEGQLHLRHILANLVGNRPSWITALYRGHQVIVPFLDTNTGGVARPARLTSDDLNLEPGKQVIFFTTWLVGEDRLLVRQDQRYET